MKHLFSLLLFFASWPCLPAMNTSMVAPDTLSPQGSSLDCNNVTNPGTTCCDQTICYGTRPSLMTEATAPTGGSGGDIEYDWLYLDFSGVFDPYPVWVTIPNAISADYQPDTLYTTQYYMREARRTDCPYWRSGNIMTITVRAPEDSLCAVLGTKNPLQPAAPLLSVAPNPFGEKTTLRNTVATPLTVTLFHMNGQSVRSFSLPARESVEIGTGDWASGLYYLRAVQPDGRTWMTKLLKAD